MLVLYIWMFVTLSSHNCSSVGLNMKWVIKWTVGMLLFIPTRFMVLAKFVKKKYTKSQQTASIIYKNFISLPFAFRN